MSGKEFEIRPIRLSLNDNDGTADSSGAELALCSGFARLAATIHSNSRQEGAGNAAARAGTACVTLVEEFLKLAGSLDAQYGSDADLPIAGADDAVDGALGCLAELDARLETLGLGSHRAALHATIVGVGYWAMRHQLAFSTAGPIVNALAERVNAAASRQEAAATFALMQGFIAHFKPQLGADLERSDPERPWRLLNLNFAIAAIRTGDPAMIRFAFTTLNEHLPDESAGFYAEALSLACQPGFPEQTRALIEAAQSANASVNSAGWTPLH